MVDHWIENMETYLDLAVCSEVEKRMIVTFFLKDNALDWWKSTKRTRDVSTLTWGEFVHLFREKYFPSIVREELELQFLALEQGSMTKFLRGFKHEYKNIIATLCLATKELIYESAMNLEQVNKLRESEVVPGDAQEKEKVVTSSSGVMGHIACTKPKRQGFFRCGHNGHMVRNCTRPQQAGQGNQQKQLPSRHARVCAIGQGSP
ncbi:uncharacterized protein LOC126783916 [Argentina anserina]|uniref:uncharacterized protein LOC126783916 n=1 Tax=Argentina anserina TaxID=57926 RepID=UPI00217631B3|nr:uncharacterized protein LOC126783916 [Potentilla anserina]